MCLFSGESFLLWSDSKGEYIIFENTSSFCFKPQIILLIHELTPLVHFRRITALFSNKTYLGFFIFYIIKIYWICLKDSYLILN